MGDMKIQCQYKSFAMREDGSLIKDETIHIDRSLSADTALYSWVPGYVLSMGNVIEFHEGRAHSVTKAFVQDFRTGEVIAIPPTDLKIVG